MEEDAENRQILLRARGWQRARRLDVTEFNENAEAIDKLIGMLLIGMLVIDAPV